MSSRIPLDTLGPDSASTPAAESFRPCAFAAGETDDAPECSAALNLAVCQEQFAKEAISGVCDTGRYRMPYWVWGQGPAIVIIPGLCTDARSYVLPMARLSRSFCCITYDLPRSHGDGARRNSPDLTPLVDDFFALADQLKLTSAVPLGISFGSLIAFSALARDPVRFPLGMVQGGFAKRPLAWTETTLARFARLWPGRLRHLPIWRSVLRHLQAADFEAVDPARWKYFIENHGEVPIAAVADRTLTIHKTDLTPILSTIRQPVLLICGDHDPIIGRSCEQTLLRGLPNVARAEIEQCGHIPQFTHPEVLCEIVEQFLGKAGVFRS